MPVANSPRPGNSLITASGPFRIPPRSLSESAMIPYPQGGRLDDVNYRSISSKNLGRELPPYIHDRMIAISFLAYRTNALAHRLIEMQSSFVLGNGISVISNDAATLVLIRDWWKDPYNQWPKKMAQRLRDLYIYGEWLHHPVVAPSSGMVYIRDLQPDSIAAANADPFNHSEVDSIIFKQVLTDQSSNSNVVGKVIRTRLDEQTRELDFGPTGELFHFGVDRTSDTMRGVGILFPVLDYLDILDGMIFSRAEKIENMSHIWWDLKLEGMSEREIRDYLAQETNVPPRPGTVYAHNAQAELTAVSANLSSDDHVADTAALKSHIISTLGWPGIWFDEPGSAGRAVGAEMAEPALKNILSLQAFVRECLSYEIDYMLFRAEARGVSGYKRPKDNGQGLYSLSFSRPSTRDFQKIGPALMRLGQMADALGNKFPVLDREELRSIVVSQINQMGLSDMPLALELPTSLMDIPQPGTEAVKTTVPVEPGAGSAAAQAAKPAASSTTGSTGRSGVAESDYIDAARRLAAHPDVTLGRDVGAFLQRLY